jgi:predicted Ser/Thr protein kinase
MIGIVREHTKERVAAYRKHYPDDTREDWVIAQALHNMNQPKTFYRYLDFWIDQQVHEDQLTGEEVLKER